MRTALLAGKPRVLGGWKKPLGDSQLPLHAPPLSALPPHAQVALIPVARDQGAYGRCAGETGREVQTGIAMRLGLGERRYSANYPYWWARALDGSPGDQDTGTYVESIFRVLATRGNCLEATWDDDTSIYQQPSSVADLEAAQHRALLAFALPNVLTIKSSVAAGFAVAFGFDVPSQMMTEECAASGRVEYPSETDPNGWDGGGHAVSLWGYDDSMEIGPPDRMTTGAFLCLNHWSTAWGENGRFYLPYAFFTHGHATDAHTLRMTEV